MSRLPYFELPEPLDEAPPDAPPLGALLGDEAPDEDAPPALGELPEELLPLDGGGVEEPELCDGLVDELLPLDGDVVEPAPPAGLVAVLPDEEGELFVAVEPLLEGLLEPLLLVPELSHATSEAADRKAAAISHLLSIPFLHIASRCSGLRSNNA